MFFFPEHKQTTTFKMKNGEILKGFNGNNEPEQLWLETGFSRKPRL